MDTCLSVLFVQLYLNTGPFYSLSFFLFVTHHCNTYSTGASRFVSCLRRGKKYGIKIDGAKLSPGQRIWMISPAVTSFSPSAVLTTSAPFGAMSTARAS